MPVQSGFQATVSLLLGKGFLHPVVAIVNAKLSHMGGLKTGAVDLRQFVSTYI